MLKLFSRKGQKVFEENYRPISILLLVSKILEIIFCKQLTTCFDNILSKYQCGFRKGHGKQHCLLLMLEKWKKAVDNKALTDISKDFGSLIHELLIAKPHASISFISGIVS